MVQVDSAYRKNTPSCGDISFKWNILSQLISEPIYERGKYRLLAVLLRNADAKKFFELKPDFLTEMVPCLENNNLAPATSKCFIEIIRSVHENHKEEKLIFWEKCIRPAIHRAIVHDNNIISREVFRYWVAPIVEFYRDEIFKSFVLSHEYAVQSRVRTMKHLPVPKPGKDYDAMWKIVMSSLSCEDDQARSVAMAIVCRGRGSEEALTSDEIDIIKQHLPLNFNSDNPLFRIELYQCMRAAIERAHRCVFFRVKNADVSVLYQHFCTLSFNCKLKIF